MKKRIFLDRSGQELLVIHRKSAVFLMGKANSTRETGCYKTDELSKLYNFHPETFTDFIAYCEEIAHEAWRNFIPKLTDSTSSDYDDYYDREYDNNGSLSIKPGIISAEGPYTQLADDGPEIRLIKFNKRKFESFVYDLIQISKL